MWNTKPSSLAGPAGQATNPTGPPDQGPGSVRRRHHTWRWLISGFSLALIAVIVTAVAFLFFNRQFAIDQWTVWTYHPSDAVKTIVSRAGITPKGQFTFYATQPEIAQQAEFNADCPRKEADSPILGCYTDTKRIYVYSVTNSQLDGIEEVTATHEMLHAIWQRSSDAQRQHLTTLITAAYNKLDDADLKARIAYYQRTEPGEATNELHSILGTEVANLGPELETYYSQYFNRSAVLALHQKYSAVYTSLNDRVQTLEATLQSLSSSIQSRSTQYTSDVIQLTADITAFNAKAKADQFTSMAAFNAERNALISRSTALEATRQAINADITTYNQDYADYQTAASQLQIYNDSIDSLKTLQGAPTLV